MSAVNPNGEMLYWDEGYPFGAVLQGTNNNSEMLFWDSGFPLTYFIPITSTKLRTWSFII